MAQVIQWIVTRCHLAQLNGGQSLAWLSPEKLGSCYLVPGLSEKPEGEEENRVLIEGSHTQERTKDAGMETGKAYLSVVDG